jgi:hypothetical protein
LGKGLDPIILYRGEKNTTHPQEVVMADIHLSLTSEERNLLLEILDSERRDIRVEERHSATTDYKQVVAHQEEILEGILQKLRPVSVG